MSKYEACTRGFFCTIQNYTVLFFPLCFSFISHVFVQFFSVWNIFFYFVVGAWIEWNAPHEKISHSKFLYWFVECNEDIHGSSPLSFIVFSIQYIFIVLLPFHWNALSNGTIFCSLFDGFHEQNENYNQLHILNGYIVKCPVTRGNRSRKIMIKWNLVINREMGVNRLYTAN